MAFQSNSPVIMTFPPFRGVTRRIILIAIVTFFFFAVLGMVRPDFYVKLLGIFFLQPWTALRREPWQLLTYAFLPMGFLSSLFALLSIWMFGAPLEDDRGSRWFSEYFLTSTVGGALLSCLASFAVGVRAPELGTDRATAGLWPAVLAVILAFARFNPDATLRLAWIIPVKAKHLAAIYVLVYMALALVGPDKFGAMVAVFSALAGFLYLRFAPGRGLGFVGSEWWYGLRNAYYRSKRRKAAKKFTVYMRKQGKDVSIDDSGRYVDPNGKPRDPNDRRWMN